MVEKITITLDSSVMEELKKVSTEMSISKSSLINRALKIYLKQIKELLEKEKI